jgi:copper chaperone CopZ
VKIIRDDVTIDLDDEINIDDVLNQEGDKKEKEDVLLIEDKGQQSIFDTLTEIKSEQEPELKVIEDNNSDSELKGIKNEDAELEVNIEQTDIQEEVEGFTEVEMNVESDKVVINLDDETTLPEELIPTLKKEEAPMEEMDQTQINHNFI